jgi:AcrR family transcriptional regulator
MAKIKTTENSSKREIILAEAAHLFWEKGYKAASMRELAARLGVEAASLYNHISSKSDLLNFLCERVATRFTQFMEEVQKEESSTIEKAEKILRFHVRGMVENYHEVFVTDREWRNLEEPLLSKNREARRSYRKSFAAILQKGIDENEIKPIDANTTVMIFINSITAVDQWHRIVHKVSSKELEDNMVTVLISGLKK